MPIKVNFWLGHIIKSQSFPKTVYPEVTAELYYCCWYTRFIGGKYAMEVYRNLYRANKKIEHMEESGEIICPRLVSPRY